VATHRPLGEAFRGHADAVKSVVFSPDGKMLASGALDHTVRFWNVVGHRASGEPLRGHWDNVNSVAFSADSRTLASDSVIQPQCDAGEDAKKVRRRVLPELEMENAFFR